MSTDRGQEEFCEGEEFAVSELFKAAKDLGFGAEFAQLLDCTGYSVEFFSAMAEEAPGEPEPSSRVTVSSEWSELRATSLDGRSAVVFTPHSAGILAHTEGGPVVLSGTDALELASELFFVASERND